MQEKWDGEEEPEEVEAVLKVVPPSYNHCLDVWAKVEAEKLTLNPTCDHHIELEESIPPVDVIYSLSNNE
ncbi:hypothetical protein O181_072427 [Austropuccinia psidii MF-1]|uniref:Uncharacterized protein n=1 Tax=Austropuccinia psidii MF-1 TaxID=1389203 RepID=A0A9Q3F9H2_9BASI|nr:hypothetical protein [Austropuccinia psidii MF-1]